MAYSWLRMVGVACVVGCGGADQSSVDAASADAGASVDAYVADATDEAAAPTLPPCNLACDRVLDCASTTCVGIDWRTARLAQSMCDDACGPQFNNDVMAAADCAAVMGIVNTEAPALDTLCNAAPCVSACQQFAVCMKQECERYATQTNESIATGCMGWCQDENAGDILAVSCDALIGALSTNDPAFAAGCHGSAGCADMATCVTYATKSTGCIVDHCAGNAEPYQVGIHELLVEYCANADDCPAPETVALLNDASLACDDPPLDAYGPAAPFTTICAGTVGVTVAELLVVCDTLIACGGAFASADICAVYLTVDAAVVTKASCIDAAVDCTEAFACL